VNKGILKIADFGFSKRIQNKNAKNETIIGTPLYKSIQILKT
jgi:serine/threonine protein kinase